MIVDHVISWSASHPVLAGMIGLIAATIALLAWSTKPSTRAPGLPGPRGFPIVGSLFQRGSDPADTYHQWSKIYGPVFRVRLGSTWAIVINSADAADELLAGSAYAAVFQSRPTGYSFDELMKYATERIRTVGGSPFDDTLKAKRRLCLLALNPATAHKYDDTVERVAEQLLGSMSDAAREGPVDLSAIFARHTQNLSIGTHFGLNPKEAEESFRGVPFPMKRLLQLRTTNGRIRDYLPFLQQFPESKTFREGIAVANFRNAKLDEMKESLRQKMEEGEVEHCSAKVLLEDQNNTLTPADITSISNSMVSSGMDGHLSHSLLWAVGILGANPELQRKCFEAIARRDAIGDLSNIDKDRGDYLMAFVKELFRYTAAFRLSLTRKTMGKDVTWNGYVIPDGTTVICNVHAMNRDEKRFVNPEQFIPERFMTGPNAERAIAHFAFGIGRRMCPATQFVHNEVYILFSEILRKFQIDLFDGESEFHPVRSCIDGFAFSQGPKPFRVLLHERNSS